MRHGDGAHFMRPDRVIRTSVLSPMVGYDPHADVQHVAMMFTQGPARGMQLQGLGAMPGPIARWWATVKARIAERKAQKFMQAQLPPVTSAPIVPPGRMPPMRLDGLGMPGPSPGMALQISPHLAHQMGGLLDIINHRYGQSFPAAQAAALVQRPLTNWYGYR